ncbi:rho guanine nucleotide exchange factor 8-like [Prosopis cineraria]|uniref:rho guanine nucleotide exchange factor 8-like n=1 Tax=Prosopis cineraria TaxID=364024 RepID=UPI0024102C3C|nr:rho guanine nucleotide exchange factor 8-like [Prosopis cineraria]XP_054787816.1 rho guanine nucleotide exchange factor 8-like [Prosopis cineraria]XP_054787817.1 rho guanine nucleotide exchange factor 8-like [Prosopis cineraria]XP_054787818.1 rho guanine nucleotide exchange factor 8-like [Prosopis cineraria]
MQKTRSFHFRRIGKRIHHLISDGSRHDSEEEVEDDRAEAESDNEMPNSFNGNDNASSVGNHPHIEPAINHQHNASPANLGAETAGPKPAKPQTEVEMIKERFSRLLLGEDMSGAGKGVSSALALSNAITNLAASVFGEQSKLAPMSAESKARWRREVDWLLSVTDHIVEFVPSKQIGKDGTCMEIMTTRQRIDLLMNIPALRKLDAMLIDTLDNFKDQTEFWYVKKGDDESEASNNNHRKSDKWWLPTVKVPPDGLSDAGRKWMYIQKDSVTQVLKAAMAINAQVLSEMEIPENYIESLPKNGRESLGDSLYKFITEDYFDPGQFLSSMDLSNEHKVLDLKNRIEASIVIWRRKMTNKDSKSSWGSAVSHEKRELFEDRAETILLLIKQKFPGLPQSSLEISKIQYNKDVGQSILESYSRVIESLAYTVSSRIEDVLYADSMATNPSMPTHNRMLSVDEDMSRNPGEETEKLNSSSETPSSMTLSDFMNWPSSNGRDDMHNSGDLDEVNSKENEEKSSNKTPKYTKKSYWDKIEHLYAIKSPIPRH